MKDIAGLLALGAFAYSISKAGPEAHEESQANAKRSQPSIMSVPARWWALAFLLTIPTFTVLFLTLGPGHFSQSTLRSEQSPLIAAEADLSALAGEAMLSLHKGDVIEIEPGLSIAKRYMAVREVAVEQNRVRLRLDGAILYAESATEPARLYAPQAISFVLTVDPRPDAIAVGNELLGFVFSVDVNEVVRFSPEVAEAIPQLTVDELLPPVGDFEVEINTILEDGERLAGEGVPSYVFRPALPMLSSDAVDFQNAYRALFLGDPLAAEGRSTRMLYYSATNLTTLGLGDITPVSTRARVLTVAESVAGVVFAGLFLSAITRH